MTSPDSLALLLLCYHLGLSDDDSLKPLTLREWSGHPSALARQDK